MPFKCLTMDPPWPEYGGGKIKRGAQRHYALIKKKEQILEVVLSFMEVWVPSGEGFTLCPMRAFDPDATGAHLWIWVTSNYLPWGLWLVEALGFKYKREFAWVKASPVPVRPYGSGFALERPGLGQYSMGQHELLLFGSMGKAMMPPKADRPRSVIMAPRPKGEDGKSIHSAKPPDAYAMIEKVSPGPRIEMFARNTRPGWYAQGVEI